MLKEVERNIRYYDGDQWPKGRAPWKSSPVINYSAWACEQWAALLSDNKPRFVYEAMRQSEQSQAEIASALRDQDSIADEWERKREEAILMARIEKASYYSLRHDPTLNGNRGRINLRVVSIRHIFMNKSATGPEDAEVLLHEYYESIGSLTQRFPTLRDKISPSQAFEDGYDDDGAEVGVPAQYVESTAGPLYSPPHHGPAAQRFGGNSSAGCLVREWWMRPKGPDHQTRVKRVKWNAGNRISTKKKYLKFADGTLEPLKTVITEGNIVYELPVSVVAIMQFISDFLGGLKVLAVYDAVEARFEEVDAPLYPNGRRFIVVGDYCADDGANPYSHGEFPYIELAAYRNRTAQKKVGDIDRFWHMQDYLNRISALIMDIAQLTGNPIVILPTDSQIQDEDITNAPGAIVRGDLMTIKNMRREKGPELPAYIAQQQQYAISQIREISGLSETATGGKFKGQQAAETVSMYQEAAGVRFRQGIRNVEQAEVKLGRQYLGLVGQFYSDPIQIKIKDALGVDRHVIFRGSDLSQDMLMKAKAGSSLPSSPSARLNTMLSLVPQGLADLPEVWKMLQEIGAIESASAIEQRMTRYIANKNELWKAPGLAQIIGAMQAKKAKSNQKNSGRSARSTTPQKAISAG